MLEHRNSQKRFHTTSVVSFLTTNTKGRYPYFKETLFCEVFVENLRICKALKAFQLFGWFLGYDHFHMQILPGEQWNFSAVMQFLKRHVSREINLILNQTPEGAISQSHPLRATF